MLTRQVVLLSLTSFRLAPEILSSCDKRKGSPHRPAPQCCSKCFPPVLSAALYSGVRAFTVRSAAPLKGREGASVPRRRRRRRKEEGGKSPMSCTGSQTRCGWTGGCREDLGHLAALQVFRSTQQTPVKSCI